MEIKGKVVEVGIIVQVTDSFKKRDLIIEYVENPQYPEYLKFEAIQDRCSILDTIRIGDEVEVFFNLKGRPANDSRNPGKKVYFNQLQVWKVAVTTKSNTPEYAPADISADPDEDDLPF